MSAYCLYCGKQLTSGDNGNICFGCWYKEDYSKRDYIDREVTELKPNFDNLYDGGKIGLPGSDIQISDNVVKWDNPSTANKTLSINGEPLSTKALHDVIVSQAFTLDATLTEVGRLNNEAKEYKRLINEYRKMLVDYKAIVDFYQKDKP